MVQGAWGSLIRMIGAVDDPARRLLQGTPEAFIMIVFIRVYAS